MMKKLKIGKVIFAAAAVAVAAFLHINTDSEIPEPGKNYQQEEILQNDNSSERYIDWNSPSISSARTEVFTDRNQNGPSAARGHNSAKTLNRESGMTNVPSMLSAMSQNGFSGQMELFPSGTNSIDHHLIMLRKLLI